jgi:hypothetical protein
MALIKVFSRSPIGHLFTVIENGVEVKVDIKGTNSHTIGGHTEPKITEVDELIFAKIKDKYLGEYGHVKLFGGEYKGVKYDPLIYTAKTALEGKQKAENSKPIVERDSDIVVSKVIKKYKKDDDEE